MNVLLVLPAEEREPASVVRVIQMILSMKEGCALTLSSTEAFVSYYSNILPDWNIRVGEKPNENSGYDAVVYFHKPNSKDVSADSAAQKPRPYYYDGRRLLYAGDRIDEMEYPDLNAHVFNRRSPHISRTFCFFPYGFLFRDTGFGPINAFGHRIKVSLSDLEHRDNHHKVIAVFGGSAAWGIYSLHEELFTTRLENLLNEWSERKQIPFRFTVLNFAQQANVVLNEIINYLLFCHRLKPDIVIAHDGWNDLGFGQITDPYLLHEADLTYSSNLEEWSDILHQGKPGSSALSWEISVSKVINYPRTIVRAYAARLRQFQEIVEGCDGIFIAGLQPAFFSKSTLSPQESASIESWSVNKKYYKNTPYLYEKYLHLLPDIGIRHFANVHAHFMQFDENHHLLSDVVHTTPEGERVISEFYFDFIKNHIIPDRSGDSHAE